MLGLFVLAWSGGRRTSFGRESRVMEWFIVARLTVGQYRAQISILTLGQEVNIRMSTVVWLCCVVDGLIEIGTCADVTTLGLHNGKTGHNGN